MEQAGRSARDECAPSLDMSRRVTSRLFVVLLAASAAGCRSVNVGVNPFEVVRGAGWAVHPGSHHATVGTAETVANASCSADGWSLSPMSIRIEDQLTAMCFPTP